MRTFAAWVTQRPFRLVLLTILFAQLMSPLAGALLVLDALWRGPLAALLTAVIATAAVVLIGIPLGAGPMATLSMTAPVLLLAVASGILLGASRSLSLAFQGTVVGLILGAFLVFALVIDPLALGAFLQTEFLGLLESGGFDAAQLEQLAAIPPIELTRVVLIVLLASTVVALFLGYWCHALLVEGADFGRDFRALRLGRVAGLALTVVVTAFLLAGGSWLLAVAPLAFFAFLLQGLAVLHSRSRSEKWHRAVLVLVYISFVSPLLLWTLTGVSAVGLLDNFFELRSRGEPRN